MVKAEKAFKWGIAIIFVFGILNAFYFLNIVIGLKIALPVLCMFLIGSILLQSGKGGGLAAIGGLGDQSAFGTRSSTFLSKITYLIGAAFIVATIFLFKLSIPTKSLETMVTHEIPATQHTHEHGEQECEHEHEHGNVPPAAGASDDASKVGMQKVAEEESGKTVPKGSYHQASMKEETSQSQSMGMNPVEKEKQTSSAEEMPATGDQKETGK